MRLSKEDKARRAALDDLRVSSANAPGLTWGLLRQKCESLPEDTLIVFSPISGRAVQLKAVVVFQSGDTYGLAVTEAS